MFGCCGLESVKFRDKDNGIDQKRVEKIASDRKEKGWKGEDTERLKRCTCPCHRDGMQVMC